MIELKNIILSDKDPMLRKHSTDLDVNNIKPEEQEKRWEQQQKFNERILSLVESIIQRIDNLVVKNNLKE